MSTRAKILAGQILLALPLSHALAADGGWKFEIDNRDHPILSYSEGGKVSFLVACGRAFGLHLKYPGTAKKDGKGTLVLANAKTRLTVKGEFEETTIDNEATNFVQWDLGYKRQDPALFGKAWGRQKTRLLDLISSGPLTVSAGGKSYRLPPVTAPDWQAQFEKRC